MVYASRLYRTDWGYRKKTKKILTEKTDLLHQIIQDIDVYER